MMVSIQKILSTEDFHNVLYPIYRAETIRFESNKKEYRIAFLSYDISQCQDIINQLLAHHLIEPFIQVDPKELLQIIEDSNFSRPLSAYNYIVYPVEIGKTFLTEEDKGIQRKMKSLGYEHLPYCVYKKDNQYKIKSPERFIYKLFTSS